MRVFQTIKSLFTKINSLLGKLYTVIAIFMSLIFFDMAWDKYVLTKSLDEAGPGIVLGIVFALYATWPWSLYVIVPAVIGFTLYLLWEGGGNLGR